MSTLSLPLENTASVVSSQSFSAIFLVIKPCMFVQEITRRSSVARCLRHTKKLAFMCYTLNIKPFLEGIYCYLLNGFSKQVTVYILRV